MRASLHDIDRLSTTQVDTWNALLAALPVRSPFLSHAFCRAIHDVRGGCRVLQIETDDGASGFLPFQIKAGRGLLGHAEKTGGAMSDMFGIVGTVRSTVDSQALLRAAGLASLRFDHAVADLCPFPFQDREPASGVRVRVDEFPRYMEALFSKEKEFVKTVQRAERRIEREVGKISFAWHAVDSHRELERLIACKREQYQRTGTPDGLMPAWRRRALHRLLEEPATSLCRPILSTLHCDGVWIASSLGLSCGDTLHVWYPAYGTQYRRYGPGHILFFRMFEHGSARGIRWFDFGEGEAIYKARYKGEIYQLWKGVIRRPSILGYSERVLQALEWRIRRRKTAGRQAQAARTEAAA